MSEKNQASSAGPLTYREAGVDIEAGGALVRRIAPLARTTQRAGSLDGLGGFGGLFDLRACGYDDPLLVAATDGVGTKLKLAFATGRHETVGIDLVAMCVNDLLVQGAEPLFFLDYFATGGLAVDQAEAVIRGIAEGCTQAGCQLLGGETAEMPGFYAPGEYDLAGFAVGAVERAQRLPDTAALQAGDVVLGLPSSGLHANGFSLLRRLVQREELNWDEPAPFDASRTLGEACLEPTRIYVNALLALAQAGELKALAHITGGGLSENIPRVLPDTLAGTLTPGSWPLPSVMDWIARSGRIEQAELLRTFNAGIGMVLIVDEARAGAVMAALSQRGEEVYRIGELTPRATQAVVYNGDLPRG